MQSNIRQRTGAIPGWWYKVPFSGHGWPEISTWSPAHRKYGTGTKILIPSHLWIWSPMMFSAATPSFQARHFSHLYQATYASELSIGCGVALRPRGSDLESHLRQHRCQYERDSRQIGFFCLAVHIYPSPMGWFRPSCQIRRRVNHSKPCQWSETGGAGSELNKWKN